MSIFQPVSYHLKNLTRFEGRDSLAVFLPWGMVGVQVWGFAMILAIAPVILEVAGIVTGLFGGQAWIVSTVLVLLVILGQIALMGASITRRLHDSGRSLAWAVPPAVLLTLVGSLMPHQFAQLPASGAAPDGFYALMGLILIYLLSVLPLIGLLGANGSGEPNRYGPPPAGK
ncbi:DUF805 domain-containing protein [Maricaulis maris]|uniref:Uncharacterized membrane protein YhaH (DUF805 family) n=1 Tax=Maricaulis maris TaxID=74318 RepID=A0A495D2C9_9PROT|nr:DUF805 domain-containing protein [Maricaulis maris]RKQ95692.1 uncharacterized membrane protein YhaH (DUF805 family) [Maricaulis maris]